MLRVKAEIGVEVKPCPKCGEKHPELLIQYNGNHDLEFWFHCPKCGYEGGVLESPDTVSVHDLVYVKNSPIDRVVDSWNSERRLYVW